MFVIRSSEEEIVIEWPVAVELPVNGGGVKKFEFSGTFARLSETELEKLAEEAAQAASLRSLADAPKANADAITFFSKVMRGWNGVQDESGKPVKFSPAALESVLTSRDGMAVAIALWRAHNQLRAGAKAKN